MNHRTFQISSELFWGYRLRVDISLYDSLSDIIQLIKLDLKRYLLDKNLKALAEKVDGMNLHMHEPFLSFSELLDGTSPSDILYLCDHCG